jgi:hypothetical protein
LSAAALSLVLFPGLGLIWLQVPWLSGLARLPKLETV